VKLRHVCSIAVLAVRLSGRLLGQSSQETRLDSIEKLELHHLKAGIVPHRGRVAVAVRIANTGAADSDYGEGLASTGSIAPGRDD
jgi:hypothetical protein